MPAATTTMPAATVPAATTEPTRIFVKVLGTTDPPAPVLVYQGCTRADLRATLCSVAKVAEPDSRVILALRKGDGALMPIGLQLPANSQEDPYELSVKIIGQDVPEQDNGSEFSPHRIAVLDAQLTAVSKAMDPIRDLHGLQAKVAAFQKRLELAEKNLIMTQYKAPKPSMRVLKRLTKVEPIFADQPKYIFTPDTVAYLKQTQFNNWQWEDNEMAALIEHMFIELGLVARFKMDLATLKRFLHTIKDAYNANPFHNFRHCFCVTQMFYGMLNECDLVTKLDPIEMLIGLVSCIIHDVDHPGFNNAYQVNARTELAIIYNDQSPLENHHCAVGFRILRSPKCNIFAQLSNKEYEHVRKGIVRCVLSTDLTKHGEIMTKFKATAENFKFADVEHKAQLLVMMVKCADISNEARPADVAEPWLDCLLEEYFAQSDREKLVGLPVAPFMDRDKVTKPGAQIGFIQFVLVPLFENLGSVLPQLHVNVISQIKKSLAYYQDLGEKLKAATAAAAAAAAAGPATAVGTAERAAPAPQKASA
ncbi:hypothetical protein AMAG_00863 [Allomyces macrogynus ATCC 38327]|uniref:Phosphodiesterase n=1 Tax=Allomyces macrogynus (strain ATCC 38327) TaxID=578462 RepID=A0A0L0RXU0_ALLM3|nr:hypothetical protein AMAG_00863 [Allomyces macrogynus ATCC 38327]|eukprot:KNE54919.1 hypothetical protein AMAG_00863 [Allomyces macrogynus ATCC 38327]